MNLLPFGMSSPRNTGIKIKSVHAQSEATAKYEQKLAEYRDTLEKYKKYMLEFSNKLEGYDKRSMDNQRSIVQTSLDLTYIKEQSDAIMKNIEKMKPEDSNKVLLQIDNLMDTIIETNFKLEGLDKNVVNRISEILLELHKQVMYQNEELQSELADSIVDLSKSMKRQKPLLWFSLCFNVISFGGIVFLVLYLMEIISF